MFIIMHLWEVEYSIYFLIQTWKNMIPVRLQAYLLLLLSLKWVKEMFLKGRWNHKSLFCFKNPLGEACNCNFPVYKLATVRSKPNTWSCYHILLQHQIALKSLVTFLKYAVILFPSLSKIHQLNSYSIQLQLKLNKID